jgi:hypothetical protein
MVTPCPSLTVVNIDPFMFQFFFKQFCTTDKVVAKLLVEMTKEKTLKGDLAVRDDDDGCNKFEIEFPNEEANDEISDDDMKKFINELQLKNVTVKDLTIAFDALKAFPEMESA